jgi:hypothetical protein
MWAIIGANMSTDNQTLVRSSPPPVQITRYGGMEMPYAMATKIQMRLRLIESIENLLLRDQAELLEIYPVRSIRDLARCNMDHAGLVCRLEFDQQNLVSC